MITQINIRVAAIFYAISTTASFSQWKPAGFLLSVPVTYGCSMTSGMVAALSSGTLYYCPSRAAQIDAQMQDASHFYLVHEYGLLAIQTPSRKLADCWAAHKLAATPRGPHYVRQWIRHWRAYGTSDPTYGSPEERISNVRNCCACGA